MAYPVVGRRPVRVVYAKRDVRRLVNSRGYFHYLAVEKSGHTQRLTMFGAVAG